MWQQQGCLFKFSGYAYKYYNFIRRKRSLVFFLIIQRVLTTAALTAFFVMALLLKAINEFWFLSLLYSGGIPMNTWLMKGFFDTVLYGLHESAKLGGAGHFRIFWQIVLPFKHYELLWGRLAITCFLVLF